MGKALTIYSGMVLVLAVPESDERPFKPLRWWAALMSCCRPQCSLSSFLFLTLHLQVSIKKHRSSNLQSVCECVDGKEGDSVCSRSDEHCLVNWTSWKGSCILVTAKSKIFNNILLTANFWTKSLVTAKHSEIIWWQQNVSGVQFWWQENLRMIYWWQQFRFV